MIMCVILKENIDKTQFLKLMNEYGTQRNSTCMQIFYVPT